MDKTVKDFFGMVIQQLRKEKKISQVELGSLMGVERAYISRLERALVQPSITSIFKIADAFKIESAHMIDRVAYLRSLHQKENTHFKNIAFSFDLSNDTNWRDTAVYINRIFDRKESFKPSQNVIDTKTILLQFTLENIRRIELYHNLLSIFLLKESGYKIVFKPTENEVEISDVKLIDDDLLRKNRLQFIVYK